MQTVPPYSELEQACVQNCPPGSAAVQDVIAGVCVPPLSASDTLMTRSVPPSWTTTMSPVGPTTARHATAGTKLCGVPPGRPAAASSPAEGSTRVFRAMGCPTTTPSGPIGRTVAERKVVTNTLLPMTRTSRRSVTGPAGPSTVTLASGSRFVAFVSIVTSAPVMQLTSRVLSDARKAMPRGSAQT